MRELNSSDEDSLAMALRILLVLVLLVLTVPGKAPAGAEAFPFNKGRSRFSLQVSSTSAFDRNYTAVGLGGGYYVKDGLEAGLDGDAWFGSNAPNIYRLSPGLRYVLYSPGRFKPYTGIFYRRTFIEGSDDRNEAGGRAGITFINGPRTSLSVGLVYDVRINCDRTVYSSCSDVYSELSFAVLF
jgi:hypothetical protein